LCQEIIPVKDAARKYGIPVEALTRLVHDGIIQLARTRERDSVITVSTVDNETATRITPELTGPSIKAEGERAAPRRPPGSTRCSWR